MLHYMMSEDGMRAVIGSCVGGSVRLSIIRLCRELAIEIPPETLDETTDIDTLRELNLALLVRREQRGWARAQETQARQAACERTLPSEVLAKVATLRQRAQSMRASANYADDYSVYRQELAQAERLEQEAAAWLHTASPMNP